MLSIVQHFSCTHANHACCGASSWYHIHTNLLIYLGSSGSRSSPRTGFYSSSLRATIMAEDPRKFISEQATIIAMIKRVIINFKKLPKASVILQKTRSPLDDLKTHWKEVYFLNSRITLAATDENKKKLSYFLQDEFLAAEMLKQIAMYALSNASLVTASRRRRDH